MPLSFRVASYSAIAATAGALFLLGAPHVSHTPQNAAIAATAIPVRQIAAHATGSTTLSTSTPLDGVGWD